MGNLIRRHPLAFAAAVAMHLAIVALMVFGLDWLHPPESRPARVKIVQAKLVDAEALRHAEKQKQEAERKRRQAELARKQRLEEKKRREAEAKRAERERKKKLEAERRRREEARKKREAERTRKLALQKKREAEKRRQAELARKRRLEEKKRREAEAKRRAEAERKRKREAERRRKEEARRKAEAERKAREAELAAQLQAEKEGRERASVIAAIKRKVQNSWLRPPTAAGRDLQAKVRVRVSESGAVLMAKVVESSGNGAFDRSVEAAVYKAEPLPMPSSPRLIRQFRDFTFIFRPSGQ